ncbi:MAG: MFS transporter [Caulobacterales bacterium]|nr:MFS transporter [Caulobacterales bacterium]
MEPRITKPASFFYGWVIVAVAVLLGFLTTGLSGYANGILLPYLSDALANGSRGQISIGISITTVVAAICAPFVGRYADEHSPRLVIFTGALLIAIAYVGIASAQSLWHYYLAQGIIFGLGVTMAGPIVRNLIVAHWFDRWRGRALGISVLGASLAGVALPLVLNEMAQGLGWRGTVSIFAVAVAGALLPAAYFVLRDRPEDIGEVRDGRKNAIAAERRAASDRADDERAWTWLEMLRNKSFWAVGLIFGPMTCVYIAISVHLFGHVLEAGLPTEQAALVLSTMALFSVLGKPVVGVMADFLGARTTIWASLGLQAVALVLFTGAAAPWQFLFAAALHGLGYSALSAMRTFALSTSLGTRSLGSSVGLLKWLELPFAVVASPLAGFVYDATGSYDLAFLVFAGFLAIACLGPFFIRDGRIRLRRPRPEQAVA